MTVRTLGYELDHPCKNTCSGWAQGYGKGRQYANRLEKLVVCYIDPDELTDEDRELFKELHDKFFNKNTPAT